MSHDWGNRITRYRDTVTEDSPALINGAVNVFRTDNIKVNEYTSITDESGALVQLVVSKVAPGFEPHGSFPVQILHVVSRPVWVVSGCSQGMLVRSPPPKTCTIDLRGVGQDPLITLSLPKSLICL